jgi:hypothetical protein
MKNVNVRKHIRRLNGKRIHVHRHDRSIKVSHMPTKKYGSWLSQMREKEEELTEEEREMKKAKQKLLDEITPPIIPQRQLDQIRKQDPEYAKMIKEASLEQSKEVREYFEKEITPEMVKQFIEEEKKRKKEQKEEEINNFDVEHTRSPIIKELIENSGGRFNAEQFQTKLEQQEELNVKRRMTSLAKLKTEKERSEWRKNELAFAKYKANLAKQKEESDGLFSVRRKARIVLPSVERKIGKLSRMRKDDKKVDYYITNELDKDLAIIQNIKKQLGSSADSKFIERTNKIEALLKKKKIEDILVNKGIRGKSAQTMASAIDDYNKSTMRSVKTKVIPTLPELLPSKYKDWNAFKEDSANTKYVLVAPSEAQFRASTEREQPKIEAQIAKTKAKGADALHKVREERESFEGQKASKSNKQKYNEEKNAAIQKILREQKELKEKLFHQERKKAGLKTEEIAELEKTRRIKRK